MAGGWADPKHGTVQFRLDYLYALADFYLKRKKLLKAMSIALEMIANHPTQRIGHDIMNSVEKI